MIDLEKKKFDKFWATASQTLGTDSYDAFEIWLESAKQVQAEITELKQKLEKLESGEWISVKDRRPQLSDCILQGEAFLAWDGREIRRVPFRMYRENSDITDWMPMPKPPKPTNLIDSFIADGGFDRVMGCKNGE